MMKGKEIVVNIFNTFIVVIIISYHVRFNEDGNTTEKILLDTQQ